MKCLVLKELVQCQVHKTPCLATKIIRQNLLQIKGNHVVVRTNIQYYTHIEISIFGTLKTTLPDLSHIDLLYLVLVCTRWLEILSIYRSVSAYFSASKKLSIRPVFLCSPLILCLLVISLDSIHKQCDNNPSELRQKTNVCTKLNNSIANSEIRSLNPLNAKLSDLLYTN